MSRQRFPDTPVLTNVTYSVTVKLTNTNILREQMRLWHFIQVGFCPLFAAILMFGTGCSPKQLAVNSLADALAGSGTTFGSDNDPELIRDAAPFSLKLMESVLAEAPKHKGLLTAASSSFTQYAYAFVVQDADQLETRDIAGANLLRDRARKLLIRGRDYGLRGLEVAHPDFAAQLRANPRQTVQQATKSDVPLLYWTAAAWGAAITISKNQPELVSDQVIFEAMIDRALALDEAYEAGSIHSMLISYEPSRQGAAGDAEARSREHFRKAVALSNGKMAGPYVSLAEAITVQTQKKAEFVSLLNQALAINVDERPEWRLANLIMQQRARWLLSRVDELFVE
jgi:predicted anti-sigma-YlaC factor YlaD